MTAEEKTKIKCRLSDIGAKVGELALNYIENLEEENAELKAQIEEMKSETEDLIKAQSLYIEDDYNAGVLNGLITVFNSIFEEKYWCCKWNENKNKWEPEK